MNKFCVLLTATINPEGCIITARNDPKVREQDYLTAMEKWLSLTDYPIVFCENSMSDLTNINKLKDKYKDRVEVIQFYGNHRAKDLGKGYGELKILEKALLTSKTIANSENIIKVTGRAFIANIHQIINDFDEESFVSFCLDRNSHNTVTIQTIIFIFKKEFFRYLNKYINTINDSQRIFFEKIFGMAITDARNDGKKCVKIQADYDGFSGGDNTHYKEFIEKLNFGDSSRVMKIAFVSNLLEPTGGDDILLNHIYGLRNFGHTADAYFSGIMDSAKEKYPSVEKMITIMDKNNIPNFSKYDLVVSNGLFGYEITSKISGINKAHFLQNFDPWIFGKTKEIDQIYSGMNKVLLYSSHLRKIVEYYYGKKIFVQCNNGINFYNLVPYTSKTKMPRSVCFMTAYYRPYKGIKLANEVFGILKQKGFTTVEICSVNGPMNNTMEFYKNPSLRRKCEIISSCEIMLHPSVFETWNLVSMESMALGTPVVGTNSQGILEYANKDNSIIIEERNAALIVGKIENLLDNQSLYNKLVINGRKTAEEHNWEKIMPSIANCYKTLIG